MDEAAFRDLISGERRGPVAAAQRAALSFLSQFYGLGTRLRNRAFDRGWKRIHKVDVPVISIGNLTTGGTGKSPMVAYLAQWYRRRGVNVGILSRGYRASTSDDHRERENDEKLVLDRLCPGVPHIQQPDRVAGAAVAIARHGVDLLILDDGFQHRRLHRDLDVVLIDATCPFGYDRVLPRGLLREPISGLKRADLVILTRVDQQSDDEVHRILQTIEGETDCPIVEAVFRPHGLVNARGETMSAEVLRGRPVFGFCGIGNPAGFRNTLRTCEVRAFREFRDHHHYDDADLAGIADEVQRSRAEAAVTTLKDLVKVDRTEIAGRPLYAIQIATEFRNADHLKRRLDSLLPRMNGKAAA